MERSRRPVFDGEAQAFRDTEVLPRSALLESSLDGPVIIESYDSTVVVPAGCRVEGDAAGNMLIEVG